MLLYRPSENKVLSYLKGPFVAQHDVDILSDHQIAIFNNNNTFGNKALYSQIVTYDFETKTFGTLLQSQLEEVNFKTAYGGTQWVMSDGQWVMGAG